MNNPPISFEQLTHTHPQLTEKALVDFVNGLEVLDDHIRVREQTDSSFVSRLWGQLNGESALRQHTIDQHTQTSLKTVATWLQCLQQQQIHSDLAVAKVAHKLAETREGVMRLSKKHEALQQQVAGILLAMSDMETKYSQLSLRIEQVDDGRLATQHIEAVFDKWEAGRLNAYPVLVRLFLVFDELYWGDFGNYCRQCGLAHREIQRLTEQVKDKTRIRLQKEWTAAPFYAWQADTQQHLQHLAPEQREVVAYLTDAADHETMPIIWTVNQLATQQATIPSHPKVPIGLTLQNAVNHFSVNFRERYHHDR